MTIIEQQLLEQIDAADSRDPQRNIKHFRERILQDITSRQRFEERRGIVTDKSGLKIDLKRVVMGAIDSSHYIPRASDAEEKMQFVSKWVKPSVEQRQKIAREVNDVIEELVRQNDIIPLDKGAFQKAISVISKNLIYGYDDDGKLVFSKLNASGIAGEKTYEFSELIPANLIDHEQTNIRQQLKNATLTEVAKKLLNPKTAREEDYKEKINQLRRKDILEKIPRRSIPRLPKSQLEDEFYRREAHLRGLDPANVGEQRTALRGFARQEMQKLDDLTDVQRELNSIQPNPVQTWEGLSYE